MKIGIYPGTFDPITNGHIDLIKRGLMIFDKLIIAVATSVKKQPLFTSEERVELIKQSTKFLKNIDVETFDGLLVEYVRAKKGIAIIRGLRAISDYEYELQIAHMNRRLDINIETVFMMPSEEYSFLSSTIVKEVVSFGGFVKELVPPIVETELRKKFNIRLSINLRGKGVVS